MFSSGMLDSGSKTTFLTRLQAAFSNFEPTADARFQLDTLHFKISSDSSDLASHLTEALLHLATPKDARVPLLQIKIWSVSTPAIINFMTWVRENYGSQLIRLQTTDYSFFYNPGLENEASVFHFWDKKSQQAIYWVENENQLPWYERAAPFRIIFQWFFFEHGYYLLHGGCVGTNQGGVLLVGKGGQGKSSTALTAWEVPELFYSGDDYVLVKLGTPHKVFCLYSSAKITPSALKRFPTLQGLFRMTTVPKDQKQILMFSSIPNKKLAVSIPLSVIIIPEVKHLSQTRWKSVTAAQALLALAPSTIFQLLPHDKEHHAFFHLTQLTKTLPSYSLQLGTDSREIGQTLFTLLKK